MSEHIIEIPDYVPPFDPAARAVSLGEKIVRCRDCRALDQNDIDWRDWCYCRNFCDYVEPNGFCAWGERRNA